MRLSTMKGMAAGGLLGLTVGAGTDDDTAGQTHEKSPEQKRFAFGKTGC